MKKIKSLIELVGIAWVIDWQMSEVAAIGRMSVAITKSGRCKKMM